MPKNTFQQQVQRRERLLGLLRSQSFWRVEDLSEHLGLSKRSIMRDIATLREEGYPVKSDRGRGGGISLQGRWGIEKLNLNQQELIEMITALAVMEKLDSPLLTSSLRQVRQKISSLLPDNQASQVNQLRRRILIGKTATQDILESYKSPRKSVPENILLSFLECRTCEIEYIDKSNHLSKRQIDIHYLMFNWPIWYVLTWDALRDDVRVFRIDRIKRCEIEKQAFKLRKKRELEKVYEDYFKPI